METNIIKMETQKVVFKMMDDDVIAIFPNNLYSEVLYGNTMVDSYMHVGQHSACSVELIDELEDASEEQYKDLKIELEEIGYNLDVDIKTIEFMGYKVGDSFYYIPSTQGDTRYYKILAITKDVIKLQNYDYVINEEDTMSGKREVQAYIFQKNVELRTIGKYYEGAFGSY